MMRKEIRKHEIQAPIYDPNEEPIMDVNRIRELLPHRYPMQLVDKVVEPGRNHYRRYQEHHRQRAFLPGTLPTGARDARCAAD